MPLSASQHEEVSSLLSVPKDLSGLLSVIPIAPFGSEALGLASSLLLSFLVGTTQSVAAWAALPSRWKRHSLLLKVSMKERLRSLPSLV